MEQDKGVFANSMKCVIDEEVPEGTEPPAATTEEWFENCGVKSTEFVSPEEWNKVLGLKQYWALNWHAAGIVDFNRRAAKASGVEVLLEHLGEVNHTKPQ